MKQLKNQNQNAIPVSLTEIEEKPKRKRGRPKKEETVEQPENENNGFELPVSSFNVLNGFINGFLASRDEKWKTTDKELKPLADSTDKLLEKYLPSSDKWSIEIGFLMCIFAFLAPRLELNFDFGKKETEEIIKEKENLSNVGS